jgi:hypothetical protein
MWLRTVSVLSCNSSAISPVERPRSRAAVGADDHDSGVGNRCRADDLSRE